MYLVPFLAALVSGPPHDLTVTLTMATMALSRSTPLDCDPDGSDGGDDGDGEKEDNNRTLGTLSLLCDLSRNSCVFLASFVCRSFHCGSKRHSEREQNLHC